MDVTHGQSWPNYIGPKREKTLACLTNPVFSLSPEGGVVWNLPYGPYTPLHTSPSVFFYSPRRGILNYLSHGGSGKSRSNFEKSQHFLYQRENSEKFNGYSLGFFLLMSKISSQSYYYFYILLFLTEMVCVASPNRFSL